MSRTSVASAALLVIGLVLPASDASAQASAEDVGTATGDVWSFRAQYVDVPRESLELPKEPLGELEIATGDVWPSRTSASAPKGSAPNLADDQALGPITR
jgi:hypothetical protein